MIIVVGDRNQAIYGFRGADSGSLDRLMEELSCVSMPLDESYRTSQAVAREAQRLVPNFKAKPWNPEGSVTTLSYKNLFEALKPGCAVLSRKNAPLVPGCLRCLRMGLKARIEGKDIGQGLIALVAKIAGKKNSMPEFMLKLENWEKRMTARIQKANGKNMENRLEEIADKAETIRVLSEDMMSIGELKERIKFLFTDSDDVKAKDYITFSSVHKAKGLEWELVFGLQDTLYPGKFGKDKQEERNIEYVMITRSILHYTKVYGL